jgi:hypothetical protein
VERAACSALSSLTTISETLDEVEADQAVLVDLHIINAKNRNVASAAFVIVCSHDD